MKEQSTVGNDLGKPQGTDLWLIEQGKTAEAAPTIVENTVDEPQVDEPKVNETKMHQLKIDEPKTGDFRRIIEPKVDDHTSNNDSTSIEPTSNDPRTKVNMFTESSVDTKSAEPIASEPHQEQDASVVFTTLTLAASDSHDSHEKLAGSLADLPPPLHGSVGGQVAPLESTKNEPAENNTDQDAPK